MNISAPNYYSNARREIAPFLPARVESVLEVGCGEGQTLLWLKNERSVSVCHGVEIFAEVAKTGQSNGLDIAVLDIETDVLPFHIQYDLILFLDVLEHLRNPWLVLPQLLSKLKPDGSVIVSLPNISHLSVLSGIILKNDWRYENAGILDQTHLRFFTRKSAIRLLNTGGLQFIKCKAKFARKTHRNINFLTFGLFERFLAYQYIFLARKV